MPRLTAAIVCCVAALTLLWPLIMGQILLGGARSDMYIAGYSFRLFGAETFKATGSIPQWNPYLFGGLPYIAAMHGDIFYPTAWLRWIMPVDLAITWGMAIHFVLSGWLTYIFARALGLSWSAAVIAGVAYQLSGIVASQMSPGHDGKLFVSALTPLAFFVLLRAIRDGRSWAYGSLACVVALCVLGHYSMAYFLLIALGLWAIYLTFGSAREMNNRTRWKGLALSALSVIVGIGIASMQTLPFLEYIKYSPRAEGAADTGWAFATTYAMPPREILTLILPEFNGVLEHYWGQNPIKFHTEYVGILPIALVVIALGDKSRRKLVAAFAIGVAVFSLIAFGGYSPLYRILFNVLPFLNKLRAMGMVFFLPAFFLSLLAGLGADRLIGGRVSARSVLIIVAVFLVLAALGIAGALQGVAEGMASIERLTAVEANETALRNGAWRLLVFAILGGSALWLTVTKRVSARAGTTALLILTTADLWSINRQFYEFSPRATVLFRDDPITTYLKQVPRPYRVVDAGNAYGHSILMAYGIPNALGYHGFELRHYDELLGKANNWRNMFNPNVLRLISIRFLILDQATDIPGFHKVVGPTITATGNPAVLYERDSIPDYAHVVLTAAKVPEGELLGVLLNPRFPVDRVVLFPDTSNVATDPITQPFPESIARASVTRWTPGRMTVSLDGVDQKSGHLIVSENWYPDWHAEVDGKRAVVRRGDHSLLSVEVPAGAPDKAMVRLRHVSTREVT